MNRENESVAGCYHRFPPNRYFATKYNFRARSRRPSKCGGRLNSLTDLHLSSRCRLSLRPLHLTSPRAVSDHFVLPPECSLPVIPVALVHEAAPRSQYRRACRYSLPSPSLCLSSYTGKSAFLLPPLDILSKAVAMYGPTTGTFPMNPAIVAKKSPNSTKIPYSSTTKPISGHLSKIRATPAANAAVPFHFCRRAKKSAVFWRPIMRVRPRRNKIW